MIDFNNANYLSKEKIIKPMKSIIDFYLLFLPCIPQE